MDFHRTDFAGVCLYILSIAKGWIGYMPPVEDLENPNYKFCHRSLFPRTEKYWVLIPIVRKTACLWDTIDLSPNIINALIATEDVRFCRTFGH